MKHSMFVAIIAFAGLVTGCQENTVNAPVAEQRPAVLNAHASPSNAPGPALGTVEFKGTLREPGYAQSFLDVRGESTYELTIYKDEKGVFAEIGMTTKAGMERTRPDGNRMAARGESKHLVRLSEKGIGTFAVDLKVEGAISPLYLTLNYEVSMHRIHVERMSLHSR